MRFFNRTFSNVSQRLRSNTDCIVILLGICVFVISSGIQAKTYTREDLVQLTQEENFSVQEKAQKYFRSYHNIRISTGMLAPSLNFNTVVSGIEGNYFGLVSSLFGFMFPSNWFQWKEKKELFQAERLSFASLIGNEVNAVLVIYYRIHHLLSLEEIYQQYLKDFEVIIKLAQTRFEEGEESAPGYLSIKNAVTKLRNDIISIQAELRKSQYELAKTANLENGSWQNVRMAKMELPDLSHENPLDIDVIKKQSLDLSYELQQFDFLIKASKWTVLRRKFSFLSPASEQEAAFGFGYRSSIKVGRSQNNELLIKQKEQQANIIYAVHEAVNNYNTNIRLYQENATGWENTKLLKQSLYTELECGEDLKLERFVALLDELLSFHSKVIQAQHKFLISQTQIDRLLLKAPYYHRLLERAPIKPR